MPSSFVTGSKSILESTKKYIGIATDDTSFDVDVIMAINAAFMTLQQLDVGPTEGFAISDSTSKWQDFISGISQSVVPLYIGIRAKIAVDPPTNSTLLQCLKDQAAELEWRLNGQEEHYAK